MASGLTTCHGGAKNVPALTAAPCTLHSIVEMVFDWLRLQKLTSQQGFLYTEQQAAHCSKLQSQICC